MIVLIKTTIISSKMLPNNKKDVKKFSRLEENEIVFACLDINKLPPQGLRCNVMCCHSEVSSGRPWSVGACVSLAE